MGILRFKDFVLIQESQEYQKSVDALRKYGMLDYSELPMHIQDLAKKAGLVYDEIWPGLDGYGKKNYSNQKDAKGNNVHDAPYMIYLGMTGMNPGKFDKESNITVYVSIDEDNKETGFHIVDNVMTKGENISKFLKNMHSIMDQMHIDMEIPQIEELLKRFDINVEENAVAFKN
jgi:hypothetical protein